MGLILALAFSARAIAARCPVINGTFERAQSYGTSTISIHVRSGKLGQEVSRDGEHWYLADGSQHFEKDESFGDSRVSFRCRRGKIVVHQDLVKAGELLSRALPANGAPGTLTLTPKGRDLKVEVSGENPVLQLVKGGMFTRKK